MCIQMANVLHNSMAAHPQLNKHRDDEFERIKTIIYYFIFRRMFAAGEPLSYFSRFIMWGKSLNDA